jgi:hypothetical protein
MKAMTDGRRKMLLACPPKLTGGFAVIGSNTLKIQGTKFTDEDHQRVMEYLESVMSLSLSANERKEPNSNGMRSGQRR